MSIFQLNDHEDKPQNDFVAADENRNKTIESLIGAVGVGLLVFFVLLATPVKSAAASIAAAAAIAVFIFAKKRL